MRKAMTVVVAALLLLSLMALAIGCPRLRWSRLRK